MRKINLFLVALVVTGCQQLQHGQMQPVKLINAKEGIYFTTCTGIVEDSLVCNQKALATCKGDYTTLKRFETLSNGAYRELTFQCKK